MKKQTVLTLTAAMLVWGQGAWAAILTGGTGTFTVANDAGRFYSSSVDSSGNALLNSNPGYRDFTYNFTLGGGGLNQLKINSSATSGQAGQLAGTATSGIYDGNFWVTTNGGKGGNDDMILAVALTGPISSDFALTIQSNGYVVAPNQTTRPTVSAGNWQTNVVNETFYGSDFIYGPMTSRPASVYQPLYNGQDPATTGALMFIDLGVANRVGNLSDQVVFSVTGLYAENVLAFSTYAYDLIGGNTVANAIGWTTPTASTGYTVIGAGVAPVPLPAAVWLFGGAVAGLVGFGRRNGRPTV
ncbi:VPLPA-CTERM sorting domain-containing protein [Methylomonas sp. MED-D]|uniref:Uncharacterized protein n=1 Tax=Methylomonas koyamae TaxID=702114 RepID=A0A177NVB5_9GAMM|nr:MULTISPECIES: VPLPA-CTERM sorting domain-containing protein [Methylomonas]MDT4329457.1 VPLPA-CTERM sorting domain-containing protein [Methylomonas sp. MV1]OAI21997.1 hypothetical protein A1355_22825 [Methylomonas koyamae]